MGQDIPAQGNWTERNHQKALFEWANDEIEKGRTSLRLLGAIPNGLQVLRWTAINGHDGMGYRAGMPDIYFLHPVGGWHGLFIELKSQRSTARTSNRQLEMLRLLEENGYKTAICHGYEEAVCTINHYEGK
jgi:hypothetical protein